MKKVTYRQKDEILSVSTYNCDIGRAYSEGTRNNKYITGGDQCLEVTSYVEKSWPCGPEVHESGHIQNATYAIEVYWLVRLNSSIGRYIGRVSVWPGCDPLELEKALTEAIG